MPTVFADIHESWSIGEARIAAFAEFVSGKFHILVFFFLKQKHFMFIHSFSTIFIMIMCVLKSAHNIYFVTLSGTKDIFYCFKFTTICIYIFFCVLRCRAEITMISIVRVVIPKMKKCWENHLIYHFSPVSSWAVCLRARTRYPHRTHK